LFHSHKFENFQAQFQNVAAMCFAWCIFYSSDWFVSGNFFPTRHGMMKEICLSLFVTLIALAMIFILDVIADLKATGKEVDLAVRGVIKAIAILIGFSWEKAFDVAVEDLSRGLLPTETTTTPMPTSPPATTEPAEEPADWRLLVAKLILAVMLAGVVVPAWRWYILPTILEYEEAEKEHQEEIRSRGGLAEPLLGAEGSGESRKFRPPMNRKDSLIGLDVKKLKVKCLSCKRRCEELEERNQKLEAQLEGAEGNFSDSAAAAGAAAIERLESEKQELENKNRLLNTSIDGLHAELGELSKLAELLG